MTEEDEALGWAILIFITQPLLQVVLSYKYIN